MVVICVGTSSTDISGLVCAEICPRKLMAVKTVSHDSLPDTVARLQGSALGHVSKNRRREKRRSGGLFLVIPGAVV